ncbi:protein translocase subunit SecD [Thermomonas brevis]|uniref:Protein translocase subunit SecD n=1 Tax=Thermomonas brevis TaxID=215691 RepID=A0A7G9QUZ9_9GAMM|nr:protein translocase subunit SecD [Thermomonas brevis]QNN47174.1 protein translocase subunit SecD [Thermomonas brevis]
MLEYSRLKYLMILLTLALSVLYAVPNAFPQDPAVQITANRGARVDDALKARVEAALKKASVKAIGTEIDRDGNLLVRTASDDDQTRAADVVRDELGSSYVVALNQASTVPAWMQRLGAKPMFLGLDLRGGVYFLMQVDRQAALTKRFEATAEDIRSLLRDNRIRYVSVEPTAGGTVVAKLGAGQNVAEAQRLIVRDMPTYQLDAQGETISVRIPEAELNKILTDAVQQNIGTLSNRINELGVAEPIIQRQGADRVAVQLPGVQDTAQAKRILGATATLEYRGVVGEANDAVLARESGNVPPEARIYNRKEIGPDGKPMPVLLNKRVIASGEQLQSASSFFDSQSGTPAVRVRLNAIGGQRMFDYSSAHVGKLMAVVYIERIPEVKIIDGQEVHTTRTNEQVISVATIQGTLGKEFQTTGLESMKEASDLALLLRAGALAAPMDFVDERTIGPSLGKENIDRGLKAVGFSFIFALGFFLIYYRMFGLITCLALLINLLMVFALMSVIGATMSLPGLAGIALTVGMSVDANVLINERIREELRLGLPVQKAIAEGYDRASGTILDANVTAFLAGLAMFAFGSGPLKGFGMTTMLGIITSAYTAVSVSRGIATLIYGGKRKLKSVAI